MAKQLTAHGKEKTVRKPDLPHENGFAIPVNTENATIEFPYATDETDRWMPRRYNIQACDDLSVRGVDRLFRGLRSTNGVLPNGLPIRTHSDAVRWILVKLGEAVE